MNFNSILVRLEVDSQNLTPEPLPLFQFHFGAVGRTARCSYQVGDQFISIPFWCGWKSGEFSEDASLDRFQFHFGAVGRSSSHQTQQSSFNISIPFWCGWKWADKEMKPADYEFQFHFGAVGRMNDRVIPILAEGFQFHFGAVGSA